MRLCNDLFNSTEFYDDILEGAWGLVNDSYLSDVSLSRSPYIIALSCMYIAILRLKSKNKDDANFPSQISNLTAQISNLDVELGDVCRIVQYFINDFTLLLDWSNSMGYTLSFRDRFRHCKDKRTS